MLLPLLFLFTVVPLVEVFLLLRIGALIGAPNAFAIVIITGVVGAWFARSQGRQVLNKIQQQTSQGQLPANDMIQGLMILIGGILLVTPGILTDIVGLSLVFPLTRKLFVSRFKKFFAQGMRSGQVRVFHTFGGPGPGGFYSSQQQTSQRESPRQVRDVVDVTPEKPEE